MRYLFGFVLLLIYFPFFGQTITSLQSAGGSSTDVGNSIQVDAAGNQYIVGNFIDTIYFNGNQLISYYNGFSFSQDAFLVKYNSAGVFQWAKKITGSGTIDGKGVSISGSGASAYIYVSGRYSGGTVSFGALTITTAGSTDAFIAQYDANGNEQWAQTIGGTGGSDYIDYEGVTSDAIGNVYVGGTFTGTCSFGSPTTNTLTAVGSGDAFVVRYDINGNVKWVAQGAGSSGYEQTYDIGINSTGTRIYVTGYYSSTTVTWGAYSQTKSGVSSTHVVCIDSAGTVQWLRKGTSSGYTIAYNIDVDQYDNIYVTGNTGYSATFTSAPAVTVTSSGVNDCYLVKYNSAGTKQWAVNVAKGTVSKGVLGLSVSAPQGNVIITGYFRYTSTFGSTPLTAEGGLTSSQDIYIASYNTTNGGLNWVVQGSSSTNSGETGRSVDVDPSYNAYITGGFGGTATFGGSNTVTSSGGIDMYLGVQSLNWLPISLLDFDAKPNDAGDRVDLSWTTATETNNHYFTVERSADGENYIPIFTKNGAGNSSTENHYTGIDGQPLQGRSYYRLKQTDYDGKYSYSKIVAVFIDDRKRASFTIYPNPASPSDKVNIKISEQVEGNVTIILTDNLGRVVYTGKLNRDNIFNENISLTDLPVLPGGNYTISLQAHEYTQTQKLIIN